MMWPIILAGLGVLIFCSGVIWCLIQQSIAIANLRQSNIALPQSVVVNQSYEEFMKKQIALNQSYEEFMKKHVTLNKSYDDFIKSQSSPNQMSIDITKKMARLYLLKRDQLILESKKEEYNKIAPRKFNIYRETQLSFHSIDESLRDLKMSLSPILFNIVSIAKNNFKDEIKFDVIDQTVCDPHEPTTEDKEIKEDLKYIFRKARCEYLSNKRLIDNLLNRFKIEIEKNEQDIDQYVKINIPPSR
ncbi:MAG: hypothetical protein ACYDIC_19955 [Desulfobaccales bacterium]